MTATKPLGDLSALTEHVLDEAKTRAARIVARAQKQAEEIIAQAEQDATAREEELVRMGMDEIHRLRRQIVSQVQLRLKEELLREKAEILGRIIGEVRNRLEDLCAKDGDEYRDVLIGLVQSAIAGEDVPDELVIHLATRDLARYKDDLPPRLKKKLGVRTVTLVPADIHGGVIVEIPSRHMEVDSSLGQLIREFAPKVEALVHREIFAPAEHGVRRGGNNDDNQQQR